MQKMKQEVEDLLGFNITDHQFKEALEYAKKKQAYIYKQEPRKAVLQQWYLAKLTEEYVRSLILSKFTMDLCRKLSNMEKEHLEQNGGTPKQSYCNSFCFINQV